MLLDCAYPRQLSLQSKCLLLLGYGLLIELLQLLVPGRMFSLLDLLADGLGLLCYLGARLLFHRYQAPNR